MNFSLLRCVYLMTMLVLLNVNGFLYMAFGIPQLASALTYFILICLVLLVYLKSIKFSIKFNEFVFILGFILFMILSVISKQINHANIDFETVSYLFAYFTSFLIFIFFLISLSSLEKELFDNYLNFVVKLLLFASIMVPLSLLYRKFLAFPPLEITRGFGLFANPNEAGIISCVCLALLMYLNILRQNGWYIFLMLIPVVGVFASFSKSAMLLLFGLMFLFVFFKRNKLQIATFIGVLLALLTAISSSDFNLLNDVGFSDVQVRRLEQVVEIIAGGGLNEGTTSSRSLLWSFGFEMFLNAPLFGNGLGSLHHMDYIHNEFGEPQGVHNLYLMLLGESGVFPFLLIFSSLVVTYLICFYKAMLYGSVSCFLSFALLFIFFVDAMATHNSMSIKFNAIFLSLVFVSYRKARFDVRK